MIDAPRSRPAALLAWAALFCVLSGLLGGCAKRPLPDYGFAPQTWNVFNAHYRVRPQAPAFAVSTSLAWSSGKKSARILIDLWGAFSHADMPDGGAGSGAIIRMDAWSNLGGSLCNLREGTDGLAALYPDQLKAYTHSDPVIGARLLGLPFPFSLADFAALLYGDFTDLVPERYDAVEALPKGGYRYTFRTGRVRSLSLDKAARPLAMSGQTSVPEEYREKLGGLWSIDFSNYPDSAAPAPADPAQPEKARAPMAERLFLTLPGDNRGSLRIQSRELKLDEWPDKAMTLNLPEGVEVRALDGAPRDWTTGRPEGEEPMPGDNDQP
ncbi:hypothetical protein [Paucidesulfovibrio longus]|uniref:hypothetical protein n=1 Tax=Paucidesulfovibrio longus TaxID=889 RepID=UPI0003B6A56A|nr:hypothetical protein [Paucidesulfovibrio longus]